VAPFTADRPRPEAVLSHSASHLVGLDDLAGIPAGEPMGPHHRPVSHIELVSTVKHAFSDRGYAVMRERYSVSHENARLFGTLDLMPTTGARWWKDWREGWRSACVTPTTRPSRSG
jgi:hypothetical protein